MDIKHIDERFSVSGQPAPEDMKQLAEQGFTTVIANRPDGEEPGQPSAEEIRLAAEAAGMTFHHLPVAGGEFPEEAVSAFKEIRRKTGGKTFGYCRTGTRAVTLNALANPDDLTPDERLKQAQGAGYDLSALHSRLGG